MSGSNSIRKLDPIGIEPEALNDQKDLMAEILVLREQNAILAAKLNEVIARLNELSDEVSDKGGEIGEWIS